MKEITCLVQLRVTKWTSICWHRLSFYKKGFASGRIIFRFGLSWLLMFTSLRSEVWNTLCYIWHIVFYSRCRHCSDLESYSFFVCSEVWKMRYVYNWSFTSLVSLKWSVWMCVQILCMLLKTKNKHAKKQPEFSEPTFIIFTFQQQSTVDVANLILESYQKFGFITAETIDSMRNAQRLKVIQV